MSGSISNNTSNSGGNFIGSGSDAITLLMSGDFFGPSGADGAAPQFTLNVDGQQIGGLQSVSASHSSGETQRFTFAGNFEPGTHDVTITFTNNSGTQGDQTSFGRGGDRNLYIDNISYNGSSVSNGTTPIYELPIYPPNGPFTPGNAVFTVNDDTAVPGNASFSELTTPGPINVGSGSDTVTLRVSEDPFQGDAQFTVSVDGKQVGGVLTTTAVAWQGQQQEVNLRGDWGPGAHTVTVTYISDKIGVTDGQGNALDNQDQNLYVNSVSYDGIEAGGTPWELPNNGSTTFQIPAGGQAGAFTDSGTIAVVGNELTDSSTGNKDTGTTLAKDVVAADDKDAGSSDTDEGTTPAKDVVAADDKDTVSSGGTDEGTTSAKDVVAVDDKDTPSASGTGAVTAQAKNAAPAAGKDAGSSDTTEATASGDKDAASDDNATITPAALADGSQGSKDDMAFIKPSGDTSGTPSDKDAGGAPSLDLKDLAGKDACAPGSSSDWTWQSAHTSLAQDSSPRGGMGSWWSQQASNDAMAAYQG